MCGIAGIYVPRGAEIPDIDMARMARMMRHRGPDGDGFWQSADGRYRTAFRRLAIIDLATGDQPLVDNRTGRVLSGNGEIYNYVELRQRFHEYPYQTSGDMEAVLAAFDALGEGYVDELNGMYALALYDGHTHALELVRDRLGVKPLYWAALPGGGIIYASEIKPLFASGLIAAEIDERAVSAYMAHGYVPGPQTLYKGINKLQPGHRLSIDADGEMVIAPYWQPAPGKDLPANAADIETYLLELLEDSVRLQLRSDVPVGTLLSGGIDSGLVVALAATHAPKALRTFTARFPGGVDESPLAGAVAERYGTEHTVIDVDGYDAANHLWSLAWYAEEPLNDAALLPNFLIERALGEHVTVSLNGTGGDELFAGYGRYFQLPVEQRYMMMPAALRHGLIEPLAGLVSPVRAWQLGRAELFGTSRGAYLHEHSTHFPPPFRAAIGNGMPPPPMAQESMARTFAEACPGVDPQTAGLAADLGTYMVDDLLTLLDRTSMAVSVEGRVPFLDHRFVEAALAVPAALRTPGSRQKHLERRMAAAYLPESVLNAPKQGFVSPVPTWFRGDVGRAAVKLLTSRDALQRGWWTAEGIHKLMRAPDRHAYRVYSLLMLELAVRTFADGPVAADAPSANLSEIADAA
ncbi:MAG: asparagine synthase (glutamine-hydrolyzing) [Rhodospirillales bacterium]|nr:asparagine synthase (glutamine-hydrolyzing) [Rhodospirillales bacterium]MBO6787693.1 asparagine synthase (glutamine-hydrolyzing) [Rhodospirillales bacterium]